MRSEHVPQKRAGNGQCRAVLESLCTGWVFSLRSDCAQRAKELPWVDGPQVHHLSLRIRLQEFRLPSHEHKGMRRGIALQEEILAFLSRPQGTGTDYLPQLVVRGVAEADNLAEFSR